MTRSALPLVWGRYGLVRLNTMCRRVVAELIAFRSLSDMIDMGRLTSQ